VRAEECVQVHEVDFGEERQRADEKDRNDERDPPGPGAAAVKVGRERDEVREGTGLRRARGSPFMPLGLG
jgi:hypothetical protein